MEDIAEPDPTTRVPFNVRLKYIVSVTWKFAFTILAPILLSLTFLWQPEEKKFEKAPHALYLTLLMAAYWVSECIPLPVTSLIPMVLVPLFGITGSEEITGKYFNETMIFLFGGCVIALSFEYSNLHTRISFLVLKSMGAMPSVLLFGMMMTCMVLSCWMNNTSTTAMMVPVIASIMDQYKANMIPKETAAELAEKYGEFNPDEGVIPNNRESQPDAAATFNANKLGSINEPMEMADSSNEPNETFVTEANNVGTEGGGEEDPSMIQILQPNPRVMDESTFSRWSNKEAKIHYWENFIQSKKKDVRNLEIMFLIGVAFSSNIGGTGVVTGTATNLIAVSQLKDYKQNRITAVVDKDKCLRSEYWDIDFLRWIILNFICMLINTLISWVFLCTYFQGVPSGIKNRWRKALGKQPDLVAVKDAAAIKQTSENIRRAIRKKYQNLGRTSFHQWMVLGLFTPLVALWILKNPKFLLGKSVDFDPKKFDNDTLKLLHPVCEKNTGKAISKLDSTWGWGRFFGDECNQDYVHDYVATMLVCFLLFIIPKEPKYYKHMFRDGIGEGLENSLLPLGFVAENLPWGPLLVLGGGLGISKAISDSNLGKFVSKYLEDNGTLTDLSTDAILGCALVFVAVVTTIASNTATAVIVCPILIEVALVKGVPPLYLVVPPIVGASYAFCLPISTPPNTIVYDKGNMKQLDMFVPGIFLTVICNCVLYLMTISYTSWVLQVGSYKGYCNSALNGTKSSRSLWMMQDSISDFDPL